MVYFKEGKAFMGNTNIVVNYEHLAKMFNQQSEKVRRLEAHIEEIEQLDVSDLENEIADLQSEKDDFEDQISILEEKVSDLEYEVADLEDEKSQLSEKVNYFEYRIIELKEEICDLKNR